MGKKPFIDRKQAKHFHVVHRSQRDPLINDPEAPDRVLQEVIPLNVTKYRSKEEVEAVRRRPVALESAEIDRRIAQATAQGIYFDDVGEYDYTQHLRVMGQGGDSVFLAAPEKEKPKNPSALEFKGDNSKTRRQLIELPASVLPSDVEMKVGVMNQPTGLDGGLQPDMDPRMREVLEALEDEEFIEDNLDDGFFAALDQEGEVYVPGESDEEEYPDDEKYDEQDEDGSYDWEAAFKKFKQVQRHASHSDDEGEEESRFDTRSKGTRFSVSSSAMHRTSQLTLLDDQFDKIEEEYMNDDDNDGDVFSDLVENGVNRQDFENILDEFLDKYEIVGRKLKQKMEGNTSARQLDHIREAMSRTTIHGETVELAQPKERGDKQNKDVYDMWDLPAKQQRPWDCQTVLSTYSNLENHPYLISDRGPKKKIAIDPKTGMPVLVQAERKAPVRWKQETRNDEDQDDHEEEDEDDEEDDLPVNKGARREKHESKEEKKARKTAVKEAKKERRETKKSTQEAFKNEETRQKVSFRQQRQARGVKRIP